MTQSSVYPSKTRTADRPPISMQNLAIRWVVRLRLACSIFFWKFILGSRAVFGKGVQIYEGVKLVIEPAASLRVGDGVAFEKGVVVSVKSGGHLEIGENVYLGEYTVIISRASIAIGRDTMIAPHCTVVDYDHQFRSRDEKMRPDLTEERPVVIGENVWIGAGCQILSGVTIGKGAVIGAGSAVTKDIPAFAVAAGSPAKVIKNRQ